jgi:hypothetical protein
MTKNIKRKKVKHTKKESLLKSSKAFTKDEEIFGCVVLCCVVSEAMEQKTHVRHN